MVEEFLTVVPSDRALEQAVVALKKGAHLLKYGRRKKPKFCPFRLSTDEKLLIWYSGEEERQLRLNTVTDIIRGQRRKQLQPEMECQSLSLVYANGERSLDLICKDKEQADSWYMGLRALISRHHRPRQVTQSCVSSPASFMRRKLNLGVSEETRKPSQVHSLSGSPTLSNSERRNSENLSCSSDSFYSESSLSTIRVLDNSVSKTEQIDIKKKLIQMEKNVLRDVWIWGHGIEEKSVLPKLLESTTMLDVDKISLGAKHAALVTKQGELFCWGEGKGGKLGHNIDLDIPNPKIVDSLTGVHVDSVSCSEYQTCVVTDSGELYTYGGGDDISRRRRFFSGDILAGLSISSVACGEWHTAIVMKSGQLFTFGNGIFGVLGHGNLESVREPKQVESLNGLRVESVACGPWHTAAIVNVKSKGTLFTWGDGDKFKLGHASQESQLSPTRVMSVSDRDFVRVACGRTMTVGLTSTGTVYMAGNGKPMSAVQGKLKHEFVRDVASGSRHVAVLTSRGNVYSWGENGNGQLGVGDFENRSLPTLVESLRGKQVESISCGSNSTAAICLHKSISFTDQSACRGCNIGFSFTRKKHNCYNCGLLFCRACSVNKSTNACLAPEKNRAFRVCDPCFNHLQRSLPIESPSPRPILKKIIHHEIVNSNSQVSERWGHVYPPKYFQKFRFENTTMMSNSLPKNLEKDSSGSDNILAIEVEKLRAQVKNLEKLSESRKDEIRECQQKTAEVWSLAKEEASKSKAAKEVINALTSRLQLMTEKYENPVLKAAQPMHINTNVPETGQLEDEKAEYASKSPILSSNRLRAMRNTATISDECRLRVKSENLQTEEEGQNCNLKSEHCLRTEEEGQNGKLKSEWLEQFQPGVYITFTTLPNGQTGLKRVRFSRKKFTDKEAQSWWEKNQIQVYQKYDIEGYNMSSV